MNRHPLLCPVLLVAALMLSSSSAAGRPAAGGALKIGADLDHLVPGRDRAALLTITSPTPFARLQVQASAGEVVKLERLGVDRWSGRYNLPAGNPPQVVILTATAQGMRGRVVGWKTLVIGPDDPPSPTVFGWVRPAEVDGTRVGDSWLYLFAAASDGAAYRGAPPQVRFTHGSYDRLRPLGPGTWKVRLSVPAGAAEELMVSVRLPGTTANELVATLHRVRGRAPVDDDVPEYVAPPPTGEDQPRPGRGLRPLYFWLGVGASVAVLAGGLGTYIAALDVEREYKDPATTYERQLELQPTGEALSVTSAVLLGVGAAAALSTALLYHYTDFSAAPQLQACAGPGGATLRFSTSF